MNNKNTKKLIDKYPKLFVQHSLPCTQTSMCWLFECGDGWFELLDNLCDRLQFDTDRNGYPQIEFTQIKEKFGSGRFYYTSTPTVRENIFKLYGFKYIFNHYYWGYSRGVLKLGCIGIQFFDENLFRHQGVQEGVISVFEDLAGKTCEKCGKMDVVKQTEGWIVTLCPECMKEYDKNKNTL